MLGCEAMRQARCAVAAGGASRVFLGYLLVFLSEQCEQMHYIGGIT